MGCTDSLAFELAHAGHRCDEHARMQQQLIEKQRMENERIVRILKENYDEFVSEIRDNLVRNLTLHRGDENQFDDLTLILLKRIE